MDDFRVAVIDSGIDIAHPRLKDCRVTGVAFVRQGEGIATVPDYRDRLGHGTAVAAILHRALPGLGLVAVRLASEDGPVDEALLCRGLEWCLERPDIRIVNISLGMASSTPPARLYELCVRAAEQGVFICASTHNLPGYECYPAYFPSVFGVATGMVGSKTEYGWVEGHPAVNVLAKGTTQRVAWAGGGYRITAGNSFACARFSGILAGLLRRYPDLPYREVWEKVREDARKDVRPLQYVRGESAVPVPRRRPAREEGERLFTAAALSGFGPRAALFPVCEKEMGTLLRFRNACPFELTVFYDYPRCLNFANRDRLLSGAEVLTRVRDGDMDRFDTLVVGYFLDQRFDANIVFGYELVETAIRCNKNLIAWDPHVYRYIRERVRAAGDGYTGRVWMPEVPERLYGRVMDFRYLPPVKAPVLLVTGTGNKQGKITAQMRLKELLSAEGYRVGHLSTEPQGALLGADFVFPYGHHDTVEVPQERWGAFLSVVMKGIDRYRHPHLILTGTQGMLVPRAPSPQVLTGENPLASLHYLCGVLPDAVICALNPQDELREVRSVTDALRVFAPGRLLFFVMTPWMRDYRKEASGRMVAGHRLLTAPEMKAYMARFEEALGLPVIDILDESKGPWIVETIERAFSKQSGNEG